MRRSGGKQFGQRSGDQRPGESAEHPHPLPALGGQKEHKEPEEPVGDNERPEQHRARVADLGAQVEQFAQGQE